MSGYVRETPFEIDFEGDKVKGTLAPMSTPDLLVLQGRDVETDEDAARELVKLVPTYVRGFTGPNAKDGSAVPIEEVCAAAYFISLASGIGRKLLEAALPPSKPSETSASS